MPGENIYDWSTTATNNGNADSSINWAEGQPRASVNNSARSLMAAHAKQRDLENGSIVTGGAANAQTFFSGNNYTTVPTGMRALLKIGPSLTNTGTTTLNMDNIGAVAIKNILGQDLSPNILVAGSYARLLYDGTNWILLQDQGQTILVTTVVVEPATPPGAIVFTTGITAEFEAYLFALNDIAPATDATTFWFRVSEDLGVTWKSGSMYRWASAFLLDTPALTANFGSDAATKIQLTNASMSNLPAGAFGGTVRMFNPASNTTYKKFQFDGVFRGSGAGVGRWVGGGMYVGSTNPINAVQFAMEAGNIASGSIKMYGLRGG